MENFYVELQDSEESNTHRDFFLCVTHAKNKVSRLRDLHLTGMLHYLTKQETTNKDFLILIIAGASADASADESIDKFLEKLCFSHFFLTFLNSQPTQSLFKARNYHYWEVQSLQKICIKVTQFSNSF